MTYNVPQFIDVEDKVAGPLTAKQLGWMIGLGATLLFFYNLLPRAVFGVIVLPIAGFFLASAFYKPNKQPFVKYLYHALSYFLKPKVMMWERPLGSQTAVKRMEETEFAAPPKVKRLTGNDLSKLARVLDTRGKTG